MIGSRISRALSGSLTATMLNQVVWAA